MRKEARMVSRSHPGPGDKGMPTISMKRFEEELLNVYQRSRKATYRKIRQMLTELKAVEGVKRTSDIKPDTISKWLDAHEKGRCPGTLLSHLKTLRTIFRYAESADYLRRDPFRWRAPEVWLKDELDAYEPADRHISALAAMRVCAQADHEALDGGWRHSRLRALVYLLTYTGMRKNEALGLKVADLDFVERQVWIRPNERRKLKTKKSKAPLGLARDLVKVLKPWAQQTGCDWLFPGVRKLGPWMDGANGYRALDEVAALGERAGVSGLTILSFRHTVATVAENSGFDQLELQRLLRHTNTQMQQAYRHADAENLRRSSDKLARGYKDALMGVPRAALSPKVVLNSTG